MFVQNKEKVLSAIKTIRESSCDYIQQPCDCKYGHTEAIEKAIKKEGHLVIYSDKLRSLIGEQNGCPELSCVIMLLETMTEDEYKGFLERNNQASFMCYDN